MIDSKADGRDLMSAGLGVGEDRPLYNESFGLRFYDEVGKHIWCECRGVG